MPYRVCLLVLLLVNRYQSFGGDDPHGWHGEVVENGHSWNVGSSDTQDILPRIRQPRVVVSDDPGTFVEVEI
jgi:hypothetical protein